jgi:hypothetical protein
MVGKTIIGIAQNLTHRCNLAWGVDISLCVPSSILLS